MLRKISLCTALIIISVLLASCGSTSTGATTVAAGPVAVTVTEKDDKATLELSTGDILTVELAGNPTTGYQWQQIGADTAILRQVGEPEFTPDSSAIGSPGKVSLRFEAAGPGTMQLQLAYQRSFEPQTPAANTFEVEVTVR